jgi:uncharacterized protein YraI
MHKILALLLLTITFLFSSQMGVVYGLDPSGDGFLSIRVKPKQAEIGKLYNGDKVQILSHKGKYYKIKKISSGQVGWAHGNWIRKTSSTSSSNTNTTSNKEGVVSGLDPNGDGFLSLRSKPKGRELGRLHNGDKLTILNQRGKWYKVKTASSGQVGWAHGDWVRVSSINNSRITSKNNVPKDIVDEWITPSKKLCVNNGGLYDPELVSLAKCSALPKNALAICKADNKRLINKEDVEKFVQSCGGALNRNDVGTPGYFSCSCKKGGGGFAHMMNNMYFDFLNGVVYEMEDRNKEYSVICR